MTRSGMFRRIAPRCAAAPWIALALLAGCGTPMMPGGISNSPPSGNTPPSNAGGTAGSNNTAMIGAIEQLMLERINRARLRPGLEASQNGIAIDEGIPGMLDASPRPPVAYNAMLAIGARRHADDMLANDYFAHVNLVGQTPFDRMRDAGYTFAAAGENLAWRGTTGQLDEVSTAENMHVDLFVDAGIADRGHRVVMLNPAFREVGPSVRNGPFTEIENGIATVYNSLMEVQDYAMAANSAELFVLGVVYDDRNNNGQYDFSEGIANSTVTLGSLTVTTASAGGYTFKVLPGTYTLGFQSGKTRDLSVTDQNIKVDLVNGTRIDVNLGLGEF